MDRKEEEVENRERERAKEAAEAKARADIAAKNEEEIEDKTKNGYDDILGRCNVPPSSSGSGPTVSAPNTPPKAPDFVVSPGGDVIPIPKGAELQ